MHLVSVKDLGASVDGRVLFAGATFGLRLGDRVGVVGPNGAGKTTLLRILAGDRDPDDGEVVARRGLRLSWLPQQVDTSGATAGEAVAAGDPAARDDEVAAILDRLDIDPDRPLAAMSGGQRRRVALARALLPPADLLVLDEPTNHLDVDAIEWLEHALGGRTSAVVMVTHDRYLLERVANHMIDLDPLERSATWHVGSYSSLLEARAERAGRRALQTARARSLLRSEVAWLRRQPRARTSKPRFRVEQVERLREAAGGEADAAPLQLGTGRRRLGDEVVRLEEVGVDRGGRRVLDGVTLDIGPGERIGVVGPNGAGKTTLLEVLAGLRAPVEGTVRIGRTVHAGLYAQEARADAPTTVIDSLLEIASHVPLLDGDVLPAARLAERFGFPPALQRTPISDLSGGERRRLALLHLLLDAPNLLLFDEPTNDLDLDTLTALESHLDGFTGTLVVASHDRYVLDRMTDRVLGVEAGRVQTFRDLAHYTERRRGGQGPDPARDEAPTDVDNRARQEARRRRRAAERQVERLGTERDEMHRRMAEAAQEPERLVELQAALGRIEDELAVAEDDWLSAAVAEEA
jgi:ABC transport system ATP-binding/permease protein